MNPARTVFITGGTGYIGSRLIPQLLTRGHTVRARAEAEKALCGRIANTTILRPWYVVGPGHRWPVLLKPAYWLAERFRASRESAARLGLVTIAKMLETLVQAVEHPARGARVLDVPALRRGGG